MAGTAQKVKVDLFEERFADFSEDRCYRYTLIIRWDKNKPLLPVIGLNPSVANEFQDDPTVRRWKGYAWLWGFGGIVVLNMFAWVETDSRKLYKVSDPVGPLNSISRWESEVVNTRAEWALASWGRIHKSLRYREEVVRQTFRFPLKCIGFNADSSPKHPLYCRGDLQPQPWR